MTPSDESKPISDEESNRFWEGAAQVAATWPTTKAERKAAIKNLKRELPYVNPFREQQVLIELANLGHYKSSWILRWRKTKNAMLLTPEAWVIRRIALNRVPDMIFDVGPNGFSGYFSAMLQEHRAETHAAFSGLALMFLSFIIIHVPFLQSYPILSLFWVLGIFASIFCWFLSWWHGSAGRAYNREWEALEAHGHEWHYENDSYFRCFFKRNDGSYRIDTTTRQQRLDLEIQRFRYLAEIRHRSKKALYIATGLTLTLSIVTFVASLYFQGGPIWSNIPLPLSVGLATLWLSGLTPYLDNGIAEWEQTLYAQGCQFIPAPRVSDPLHEPLTLEKVKEKAAMGDAAFSNPLSASLNLGA